VEHGDQFVVSATPEHIVLKKKVDDIDFPFDEKSLADKAMLIHPVVDRALEGVYSRATSVSADADTYIIEARPLTLEEMASMTEDDIVRIYVDLKSLPQKDLPTDTLQPSSFHTLAFSSNGLSMNGLNFTGFDFGSPIDAKPGISITHTIDTASLDPQVLADYSSDSGLALGFRGEMAWKSTLKMTGRVSGEFFHSKELESPSLPVYVPIGPVPVPVTLHGKAFISCGASGTGPVDLSLDIDLSASISASMQIHPSANTDLSKWVSAGPWPTQATGSAHVTPSVEVDDSNVAGGVSCAIPRIELHADVAGVAGPYLAITPAAILRTDMVGFKTTFAAGVSAGALGFNTGVEVVLFSWEP
jgi:hypothetical protein